MVPLFCVSTINAAAVDPKFLPSFWFISTKASKRIVILIASISDWVIVRVTDWAFVTATPTDSSVSISLIAFINVWLLVPNLGSNLIFWKLKSESNILFGFALALTIGVFPKNISFNAALLYASVPFVNPAADGKPSISPSEITSIIFTACLLSTASPFLKEFISPIKPPVSSGLLISPETLALPKIAIIFSYKMSSVSIPADTTNEPVKISP